MENIIYELFRHIKMLLLIVSVLVFGNLAHAKSVLSLSDVEMQFSGFSYQIQNDTLPEYNKSGKKGSLVNLYGEVVDSFTRASLKAFITIMTADSVVIDTTSVAPGKWNEEAMFFFKVPRKTAKYILKAESEGYHTSYTNYEIRYLARNRFFEMPKIEMKRKMADEDPAWDNELEGVTVKGTRVKVINKGDTIIFNAAAFNLPEGSMLDNLIRQMPGVELKDNGDIYVNGRKVDYLTLNGEDFFKGNNKMMLDNMPYYTVENVKVYNKETTKTRITGLATEMKDYVMDVRLKREYNRNYLANAEVGAGTRERYLGRVFGLYFDDHNQFSVFGNLNNINENRKPGSQGDWTPSDQPEGIETTRLFGFNLKTSDHDKNVTELLEGSAEWGNTQTDERTATEQFATQNSANIFSRRRGNKDYDRIDLRLTNTLEFDKPMIFSISQLRYYTWDNKSQTRDASFSSNPSAYGNTVDLLDSIFRKKTSALEPILINSQLQQTVSKYKYLNITENAWFNQSLPWGDQLGINMQVYYNKVSTDNFSLFNANYRQLDVNDIRNTYAQNPDKTYSFEPQVNYTIPFSDHFFIMGAFTYLQKHNSTSNNWHRLDRLGPDWDGITRQIGQLPSTRDSLLLALDTQTSYNYSNMKRTYAESLTIAINNTKTTGEYNYMNITLPISQNYEKMRYYSPDRDTTVSRHYNLFEPQVTYYSARNNYQKITYLSYNFSTSYPELTQMVAITDNRMPTTIRLKNTLMKPKMTHSYQIMVQNNDNSHNRTFNFRLQGDIVHGSFGTRTYYLPTSGTYIYQNANVNGNYSIQSTIDYGRDLDKKKHWHAEGSLFYGFYHSVDFAIQRIDDSQINLLDEATDYYDIASQQTDQLSKINNSNYGGSMKLTYQLGSLTAGINGNISWRRATSKNEDFSNIHAREYKYGATLQYRLPLSLQLATDFNIFQTRGYQAKEMNTDNLIWNASLSRSFIKGKLTCTLEAFDLLHQLKTITYSVGAQGRTETWKQCIPNYAILKLAYKFSKK